MSRNKIDQIPERLLGNLNRLKLLWVLVWRSQTTVLQMVEKLFNSYLILTQSVLSGVEVVSLDSTMKQIESTMFSYNYLTALQFPHVLLQWQNCSLFALHYVTGHCHKIISVPYQVRLSPISPISSICKLNIMIITFFISNLEWLQFLKITLMFSTFRLLNDNRLTHIPNRAFKSLQKLKVL